MTGPRADQMRAEQQRQTDDLTASIRELLRNHAASEEWPMLGAAVSALAQNLGETIGQIETGPLRKTFRDEAGKIQKHAERTTVKLGVVRVISLVGKH